MIPDVREILRQDLRKRRKDIVREREKNIVFGSAGYGGASVSGCDRYSPEMQAAGMGDTYTVTASDFRYNTREMPVGYFELSNGKMAFCACHEAKPLPREQR